jgi:crotonobetainyl-CoA:carnitine CoA-transferase CaiB-like acyl-CoA transferase
MAGALDGIKVLDFSRLLPFEYCTMMLADLGAEVLKVEEPKKGDYMRWLPPKNKKEGYIFLLANRNKKSMTLNFNTEKGREIVYRLIKKYDVLFESFRPGIMDGFGLGYKDLKEINPRLVYCSSTGYGQTGPYKDKAGHDANYIAVAGILGVTGRHTGAPIIPGIPVADMSIGIFSAYAILAGLMARDRTGKGQHIDVSMTDCMVSYNTIPLAHQFAGQEYGMGKSSGSLEITGHALWYNCFETRDGKYLFLGNLEKKFWTNLCKAIGREDFVDFEFATGKKRDEIIA